MRRILYFFNIIRSAPVWLISIILGVDEILCEDMEGYRYAVELETERKLKRFWLFNRITAKRKLFHNVVQFRIKNKSKLLSYIVAIFLPIKKDLEISQGEIGGGAYAFSWTWFCDCMSKSWKKPYSLSRCYYWKKF